MRRPLGEGGCRATPELLAGLEFILPLLHQEQLEQQIESEVRLPRHECYANKPGINRGQRDGRVTAVIDYAARFGTAMPKRGGTIIRAAVLAALGRLR